MAKDMTQTSDKHHLEALARKNDVQQVREKAKEIETRFLMDADFRQRIKVFQAKGWL